MNTALVTGAGRGIGRAAAASLSRAGVRVLGLDLAFPGHGAPFEEIVFDLTALDAPEIVNGAVIDLTDGCFLR